MTNPNPTPSTLGGEGQSQSHRDRQSNRLSEGELTYAQAMTLAEAGSYVMRSHWHWCAVRRLTKREGLQLEHDDGRLERWFPSTDDIRARDWLVTEWSQ